MDHLPKDPVPASRVIVNRQETERDTSQGVCVRVCVTCECT